ncbi:MAG: hypothetical protein LH606_14010 [Cytophagaceae bacterium]|nr:hypothetical protein [Cytophagaceae bacterium]
MKSFDFKSHYEKLEQAQTDLELEQLRREFDAYWDSLALEELPEAREHFSAYLKEFNQEQGIRIDYLRKILTSESVT